MAALIVSYSGGAGGAERTLADHAPALGPDTCVACPEGPLAEALRERGVRTFALVERPLDLRRSVRDRAAAPLRVAAHAREVRALAGALRPHVVIAWGLRSLLACAAARLSAPLVYQHVDLLPGPAIARATRAATGRCALVTAHSATMADDLDPDGGIGVRVIRPGVDLERFAAGPPPERPSVLFLSALVPWKRPDLAIEACSRAGLPLVIAGGPVNPAGERYAAALRRSAPEGVTFAGRLADSRDALREATCLIHCAEREPFGLALVEALASGVPVVAPAAGGPTEIVDDTCGRLYPPGDAAAAAAALTHVVRERDRLAPVARARAERSFDLRRSRRAWADAIAAAAAPPPPASGDGIAVVTVLHDSESEVRVLMASLERHLPGAHLVAVDSGSSDGGATAVRAWSGHATVLELGDNIGYGRGTNAGIAAVEEPVTVIANPDVELLDASLAELAAEVRRTDRILAPLVLHPDGTRELSAHPEPASAPELARAVVPPGALPRRLRALVHPSSADRPRRVAWAVGCCLVARTDTLRRLGPFDERVFLYAEDMDLGLRAADAGVETWFWPSARVLHRHGHATERAFGGEAFELLARRRAEVVRERRGAARARLDSLALAVTYANRISLKWLLRRPVAREREQLHAIVRTVARTRLGDR